MSHDRSIQVIQHRTFLQPQGLYHGQHPLHEPASCRAVATKGVLPPQHAQPQDAFRMVVCGLDSLDRREQPQRRVHSQDVRAEGRCLGIRAGATLLQNALEFAGESGPPELAGPVGPIRRRGTPTSRRTGIPRPPDPLGQLLQRVLLDRSASESRVSGGPSRFDAVSAAACCRPTSDRYRQSRGSSRPTAPEGPRSFVAGGSRRRPRSRWPLPRASVSAPSRSSRFRRCS